jgi:hypothetical protein
MASSRKVVSRAKKTISLYEKAGRKAARKTMRAGADLAAETGSIMMSEGVSAALAGLTDVSNAGRDKLALIAAENNAALSGAGSELAGRARGIAWQASTDIVSEWSALSRNALTVFQARSPIEAMQAQSKFIFEMWSRMLAKTMEIGESILEAQRAIAAPIKRTAATTALRLVA